MTQLFEWDYSGYPGAKKYPNVFKPITIGKLTIPNRVKYAATEDNLNSHDGFVTDEDVAYIQARAKGVAGGICTIQGVYMDERAYGQGYVGQAAAWDDKFVPGLKRLADAIRTNQGVYMDDRAYGLAYGRQAAAWNDPFVPVLKRFADASHEKH